MQSKTQSRFLDALLPKDCRYKLQSLVRNTIFKYDNMSLSYKRFENENYSDDQLELCVSKEIKVYNVNRVCHTVLITPRTTPVELCLRLTKYIQLTDRYQWSIVEMWENDGLERMLENHESVLACYHRMEQEKNATLLMRLNDTMFEMFKQPRNCLLYRTLDIDRKTEIKITEKILNGDMEPLFHGQVAIYDETKPYPSWEQRILLLENKKLYLLSSHRELLKFYKKNENNYFRNLKMINSQDKCVHKVWVYIDDVKVYNVFRNLIVSPGEYCLCLVTATGQKRYIAIQSKLFLYHWMCAMRLSKYGKQLRDNYRSFVKKQNDTDDYEYNKKPLPNESVRSHVAMDFSGNVGRIVEDPKEALAIAQAEIGSVRRSWRSSGRNTTPAPPDVQVAVTRLENDIHLSQPWYHKNMSRDQAASILNGLAYKDGVFLIRESRSKHGTYVLSFKHSGKIVHAPISAQMDPINDLVCFSLDNGTTKFYDLLQLVEFYQLNAGSLPTRLMHYIVHAPGTK